MEPRLGKSKAALDAVAILALKGEVRRVAILSPKISLDVWDDQIRQHFPLTAKCETHEEEWSYKGRDPTVRFYLIGYERYRWRRRKGRRWLYPYGEEVEDWEPDLVICDESHRLKRSGGVTAQFAWRMVSRLRQRNGGQPHVFLLSGTPRPKGWIDLFSQLRILDDRIWGTSRSDFEEDHVDYGLGPLRFTVIRYRGERRLQKALDKVAFTCTAEEAGLAGKVFFQSLRCELPPRARRVYDEVAEEFIAMLESGSVVRASNPGVKRLRLAQITGGFTTDGEQIHHAKLDVAEEYLALLREQKECVVLYATYIPEVHALQSLAESVGFESRLIYGRVKDRDRTSAVKAFGRSVDCLVFQVQSGSVSLDLSAAAEVVFYTLPDGWENYYGAYQRVLGPHQKRPVRVTHILARGTVDTSKVIALQAKEDGHRQLFKDPRRYLWGLLE